MKQAIIEVAAVNLHCPSCDTRVAQTEGNLTWLREDFSGGDANGRREQMLCPHCNEEFEIPKYAEVFPL